VQGFGFIHRWIRRGFMAVDWQWYRSISVLQLSVASISLPMHHSHLLICHQHQIISQTHSVIK
jgi:hypothetical protein